MEWQKVKIVAHSVYRELQPSTTRLNFAGSFRREAPNVGDLEILLIPEKTASGGQDLFGETEVKEDISEKFRNAINRLGKIVRGKPSLTARYIQIHHQSSYGHIALDIFIPVVEDYWRQYVIRTGSRDFVFRIIATGWRRMGWCGVEGLGLRKVADCRNVYEGKLDKEGVRMKPKWELVNPNPELPPVWKSEEEFFDWINVKYIHPKYRI